MMKTLQCDVIRLTCNTMNERLALSAFRGAAEAGKDVSFIKIFPWETLCDLNPNLIHYIAYTPTSKDPKFKVYGWMTVKHMPEWNGYYIVEITTRGGTNKTIKGVGRTLHNALLADIHPNAFVYLYPLDDAAAGAYTRWGYTTIDDKLAYMFYRNPMDGFIDGLHKALRDRENMHINDSTMKRLVQAEALLPTKLLQAFKERISTDPSFVDIIHDIDEMTDDEKRATLEVFLQGGHRKLKFAVPRKPSQVLRVKLLQASKRPKKPKQKQASKPLQKPKQKPLQKPLQKPSQKLSSY